MVDLELQVEISPNARDLLAKAIDQLRDKLNNALQRKVAVDYARNARHFDAIKIYNA